MTATHRRPGLVLPRRRLVRFRALALAALVVATMLLASLGSQRLAQRHAALAQIDRRIDATELETATLRTELDTRASLSEVQRWNGSLMLAAPRAEQFVRDAGELHGRARPADGAAAAS